jgi:hypothetical protein
VNGVITHLLRDADRLPDSIPWATFGFGAIVNMGATLGMTASEFALIATGIAGLSAAALSVTKIYCKLRLPPPGPKSAPPSAPPSATTSAPRGGPGGKCGPRARPRDDDGGGRSEERATCG